MEKPKSPSPKKSSNWKQIKTHRLITSDEIYLNKKKDQEEKQRTEKEKEERKTKREQKQQENQKRKMSTVTKSVSRKQEVKK